ncbi:uncharacterized protein WCC33_009714 [Rhinophrynus dorsalis]
MAALKVLLVLTAICIGTAVSLKCYTCTVQSSNSNCMTATNCTAGETYCKTSVVSAGIGSVSATTITKTCASSCTASSFGVSVASTSVACCSTDLCNTSGAYGIKSSYAALALALGFLSQLRGEDINEFALKVLLVLTAVCIGTAISLKCYTCTVQSSNSNCMTATNCTAGDTYCKTSVVSAGIGSVSATTITKTCASSCTASSFGVSVASTSVACCSTDLCNTSGAYGIKSSYAALALALGFLSVLLKN